MFSMEGMPGIQTREQMSSTEAIMFRKLTIWVSLFWDYFDISLRIIDLKLLRILLSFLEMIYSRQEVDMYFLYLLSFESCDGTFEMEYLLVVFPILFRKFVKEILSFLYKKDRILNTFFRIYHFNLRTYMRPNI